MGAVLKGMIRSLEILPFVLKKYPELSVRNKDFAGGLRIITKYVTPVIDDRWDKSWLEWMEITEYAKAHGHNGASRRFYAIKKGKRKYLTPKHIEQKIKEVDAI